MLVELDQEAFAAGWAHGWGADDQEFRVYDDERSPEATAYAIGQAAAIHVKTAKKIANAENQDN